MAQLFRNNAFSNLGASLTNSDTTLTVTTGHGDRFPVVAAPDFFLLTLQDASNNIEIVRVTARTAGSDSMTIQRAQEGTSARAWNIGDVVELRLTASALGPLSLLEGASTAATVRAAIDAAASSHTHQASQIADSTAVGRSVLTAADQAAARSAIGAPATDGTGATGTWGVSVTGNAATATKLQTARTITIGNTGKSVDGSADVSWSLAEIGVVSASDTTQGIVELATAAEAQALASATLALTPARLADAFKGANQSLSANGYQRLPGGLIIQWGIIAKTTTTSPLAVTFPITFPNAFLVCNASIAGSANPNGTAVSAGSATPSGFQAYTTTGAAGMAVAYIAIGY